MQILLYIFWMFTGATLAFFYIKSQQWSVFVINPRCPRRSTLLIIGGAFMRWLIIATTLILALRISFITMLLTFSAFLIAKFLMLLKLYGLSTRKNQLSYIKD